MPSSAPSDDIQYGALPFRFERVGMEIMLITSRETGRWIIPKGWPMQGKKSHHVAALEAFQEAGIKGLVSKKPIGAYPSSRSFRTAASASAR